MNKKYKNKQNGKYIPLINIATNYIHNEMILIDYFL